MPQFHCDKLSKRSRDSSMGQEERTSVERRVAAGRLQDTFSIDNER